MHPVDYFYGYRTDCRFEIAVTASVHCLDSMTTTLGGLQHIILQLAERSWNKQHGRLPNCILSATPTHDFRIWGHMQKLDDH